MAGKATTLAGVDGAGQHADHPPRRPSTRPSSRSSVDAVLLRGCRPARRSSSRASRSSRAPARTTWPPARPGRSTILRRNPYYTGSRPHDLARITIAAGTSDTANALQVRSRQARRRHRRDLRRRRPAEQPVRRRQPGRPRRPPAVLREPVAVGLVPGDEHEPSDVRLGRRPARRSTSPSIARRWPARAARSRASSPTTTWRPACSAPAARPSTRRAGPDLAKARALAGSHAAHRHPLHLHRPALRRPRRGDHGRPLRRSGSPSRPASTSWAPCSPSSATKGEAFDIADVGFTVDYPDPGDFLAAQLDSKNIHESNNSTFSYLHDAKADTLLRDRRGSDGRGPRDRLEGRRALPRRGRRAVGRVRVRQRPQPVLGQGRLPALPARLRDGPGAPLQALDGRGGRRGPRLPRARPSA